MSAERWFWKVLIILLAGIMGIGLGTTWPSP
jgi:hypothetical protein